MCGNRCLIGGSGSPCSIDSPLNTSENFPRDFGARDFGQWWCVRACLSCLHVFDSLRGGGRRGVPKSLYIHVDERKMILINPLVSP